MNALAWLLQPRRPKMTALYRLMRTAQLSGERLTISVSGNVTTARWSRGRGRRAEQVSDYRTADVHHILEVLAARVLPEEETK